MVLLGFSGVCFTPLGFSLGVWMDLQREATSRRESR
jgi:hypothetical protein